MDAGSTEISSSDSTSSSSSNDQGRQILYVSASGSSSGYKSIAAAIQDAEPGAIIRVAAGRYQERLVLHKPVTVEAYPQGSEVEVVCETKEPYQYTVEIGARASRSSSCGSSSGGSSGAAADGSEVVLRGLRVRHYSKSVANNYAVYITEGSPRLEDCDISSSSGSGIAVEGGCRPALVRCKVQNCARHGIGIFGALDDGSLAAAEPGQTWDGATQGAGVLVQHCQVVRNKLSGVLLRGATSSELIGNTIQGNGDFGILLQDASGVIRDNQVSGNGKGAVSVALSFSPDAGLDLDSLRAVNKLMGLIQGP